MKYYTEIVPLEIAAEIPGYADCVKRRDYAEVFDWMLEKDISIEIEPEQILGGWLVTIERISKIKVYTGDTPFSTWHEAANVAIKGAIEILKEKENE